MRPILKAGCLAYLDSFAGLVPCKVVRVYESSDLYVTRELADVQFTATRGAYKRGKLYPRASTLHVVPRECIRRSRYKCSILPYDVEVAP